MTSTCSECGALKIAKEEPNLVIPVTTSWTLARCQKLAKSNEPPNAAERAFLRAVVPNTAARLACLEDKISRLRERLALLENERAELADYHSQNTAVLSPLRRMPSELIAEIFSWSLPSTYEMDGDRSDVKKSPWVLAQVSSRWRSISLSTPSLWSLVQVWGDKIDDCVIQLVRTQVKRARKLKIHFYASEDGGSALQTQLFDFLSEHAPRWEEFSVQLIPALVPRLDALRGRLPSLQKLWIQWDREENHAEDEPIKCFETVSSLLDVGMQRDSGHFISVPFPTHQLTSYRVQGPWDMHQQVLKLAPNVVEVQIIASSLPAAGGPTLDLLHLRRLYVSKPTILDHIRAPRLDEIAFWMDQPQGMVERLDSFLCRSSCSTLRRLHIRGSVPAAMTAKILKKYPSITSLVLGFNHGADSDVIVDLNDHLTTLSVRDDSTSMLSPRLTEIHLGFAPSIPIDYPLFLEMLQSRRKNPRCALNDVVLLASTGPGPDPVSLDGLNALADGGMGLLMAFGAHADKEMERWIYSCPWI